MTKDDINKALFAFRWNCPEVCRLSHFDGTTEPYECYDTKYNNKRRNSQERYRCDGKCERGRKFVEMLKEPME